MNLGMWYRLTFIMHHEYNWSIDEMESMYPFEFDIYTSLLTEWLEEKKKREEQRR